MTNSEEKRSPDGQGVHLMGYHFKTSPEDHVGQFTARF
jgi:hypothetical protein